MDFRLSEDHLSLQKAAKDFLAKECTTEVVRASFEADDGDAPGLYKKMADLGWLALSVPEELGGLGMGLVEQAVLFEQLGYYLAPGPYFSTACLAIPALVALKAKELLSSLIDGSKRATLVTDKEFVLDGQLADAFITTAGEKAFWVERSDAEVTPHLTLDGTRRTASVEIPRGAGAELGSTAPIQGVIDSATAVLSAESVGGMQRVLDMTVSYAKTRTQFGREIGSFQVVKHRLADVLIKLESARSAAYYASWSNGANANDAAFSASVAKAYASDAYVWIAGEGIQLHGGIGYTWEHDAHLWFKRAVTNASLLGDAEFHRERALSLINSAR